MPLSAPPDTEPSRASVFNPQIVDRRERQVHPAVGGTSLCNRRDILLAGVQRHKVHPHVHDRHSLWLCCGFIERVDRCHTHLTQQLFRIDQLGLLMGVAVIGEEGKYETARMSFLKLGDPAIDLDHHRNRFRQTSLVRHRIDVHEIGQQHGFLPAPRGQDVKHLIERARQGRLGIGVTFRHPQRAVAHEVETSIDRQGIEQTSAQGVLKHAGQPFIDEPVGLPIKVLQVVAVHRTGAQHAHPGVVGHRGKIRDQRRVVPARKRTLGARPLEGCDGDTINSEIHLHRRVAARVLDGNGAEEPTVRRIARSEENEHNRDDQLHSNTSAASSIAKLLSSPSKV